MKFLLFLLFAAVWSQATIVKQLSFPEVVRSAAKIVIGTVSDKRTFVVDKLESMEVITLVTFTDLEVLKGDHAKDRLVLEFPGGELPDGSRVIVPETPTFQLDQRVVLFISRNQNAASPLVGVYQGLYRLADDSYDPVVKKHNSSSLVYEELTESSFSEIDYEYSLPVHLGELEHLIKESM